MHLFVRNWLPKSDLVKLEFRWVWWIISINYNYNGSILLQVWFQNRRAKFRRNERSVGRNLNTTINSVQKTNSLLGNEQKTIHPQVDLSSHYPFGIASIFSSTKSNGFPYNGAYNTYGTSESGNGNACAAAYLSSNYMGPSNYQTTFTGLRYKAGYPSLW